MSIDITIRYLTGESDPLVIYEIPGWAEHGAEIYSIGKDLWLALQNTRSTGWRRKVFKTAKGTHLWIMKGLRKEFPCDELHFRWDFGK